MVKKKILISGAGPAGLMVSLLLDENKFDITVVEKSPKFVDMGFSIILWQKGFNILLKAINKRNINKAYPLNNFTIYAGENVKPMQRSDTTGIGHSIRRKHLMKILSKKFISKWGKSNVIFSDAIKTIDQLDDNARVTFLSGKSGVYDLVIISDGMHSRIRNMHFSSKIESLPYRIKYAWVKRGSKLDKEGIIGFMQGYVYLIQTVGKDSLLAYYTHANDDKDEEFVKKLKEHFEAERGGKFELNQKSSTIFASEEVSVDKPYNGRVVLIGDSYHGHPPTLAMGTSMAFEDANELAELLNSNIDFNLSEILKEYAERRSKVIRSVYNTQKFVEKLSISDSGAKLSISEDILKYGGWKILEPILRKTFSE